MTRSTKHNSSHSRRKMKNKGNKKMAHAEQESQPPPEDETSQNSRTIRAPIAHRTISLKESGVPGSRRNLILIARDNITAIFALREFTQRVHGDVSITTMQWYNPGNSGIVGVLVDFDIPPNDRDEKPEPTPNGPATLQDLLDSLKDQERILENRLAQMKPEE